jgi:hypothetical protein
VFVNAPSEPQSARPSTPQEDEPVLPEVTRDERDVGWGDDPESRGRDADWYERERPPHHE